MANDALVAELAPPIPEDPEARSKRLTGAAYWATLILTMFALVIVVNQVFNLGAIRIISTGYYYLVIGVFGFIGFLAYPATRAQKDRVRWFDWILGLVLLAISTGLALNSQAIIDRGWEQGAPMELAIVAGIFIALVLEALRRTGEVILFLFCLVFGAYPLYAAYMPGFLWGVDLDLRRTVSMHALGNESIIGIPTQVVADTLIGFLVFGVVLAKTGGGEFFMNFASALMGTTRGGPAKVAVVSSGFFGMLSGSPTSNVLTTGTLTIPTMKKTGYPAVYAAAVEACASTGGALMPPVMGTAAFIMANFLNVPYSEVVVAAFLPAILFYMALLFQTDLFAARNGLRGLPRAEVPPLLPTLKQGWFYLVAIVGLTLLLLTYRIEAEAPFYIALFLLLVAVVRRKATGFNFRAMLDLIVDVGQSVAQIICLIAGIGLIVGAMSATGVANSFSRELVQYAGGNIPLMLLFGAITSFILGMGMTASACYIFLAIVLAPALIQAGLDPMASHLYIFYWGIVSFITPPVALAAIAAASIAKADAMATGFKAIRIGCLLLLLPVLFVLQPALILKGEIPAIVQACITATIAIVLLAASFEGYLYKVGRLPVWGRLVIGIGGLLMLIPEPITDFIGAGLGVTGALAVWLVNGRKIVA
jgi:TRAP transporter 4TM/12TM fusion protein